MEKFVYTYQGRKAVLVDTFELSKHDEDPSLEVTYAGHDSLIWEEDYDGFLAPLGIETHLTYDDSYSSYGGDTDINIYVIPNIENEQKEVRVFASEDYGAACSIEMQYGVLTDRYYDWTSEVTRIYDRLITLYSKDEDYIYFDEDYKEIENDYYTGLLELQNEYKTTLDYKVIPFEQLVKDASYGR